MYVGQSFFGAVESAQAAAANVAASAARSMSLRFIGGFSQIKVFVMHTTLYSKN